MTCGLPWPPGLLDDESRLVLTNGLGQECPLQVRVLDRWPDGTLRWCLLDWFADTDSGGYEVAVARSGRVAVDGPLRIEASRDGSALTIDTGAARFRVEGGGRFPFESVQIGGEEALDASNSGFFAEDERRCRYRFDLRRVAVLESGPLRAALRLGGKLVSETASPLADVAAEIHFFARSSTIRCDLTMTNPRAAGHPGGRWGLGARGSVFLRDASLTLSLPPGEQAPTVRCSAETNMGLEAYELPLEIYQGSSGGENWRSRNHANRRGTVPHSLRGYRLRAGDTERFGLRATPIVVLQREKRVLTLACEHFWQNFPKAIEASGNKLILRLFPEQYEDVHELQGGERKTHRFFLAFDRDEVSDSAQEWFRQPLLVHAEPGWYAEAQAAPYLVPEAKGPRDECQELVDAGIEGGDSFVEKREVIDEYGWRHFGELYADHEAVHHRGSEPLISHYNNQYDAIAGFAAQFMRSGDSRWFRLMDELARHVIDIDLYHTDDDKSAYNRGQFWHTVHYVDAGTSTHRSYPAVKGIEGGGPSSGQLYTTGLLQHHFLTGSAPSREAAIQLGQYVIDADDGTRTVFRFLDRGFTGHASLSSFDGFHGAGRSSANSLNALVDAYRLTGRERYLEKAEQLIRRCIHPQDDLDARNLGDVEGRWFYTMFLSSLGKYLDCKALLGANDRMYAYARASLLHYAAWARDHEYVYLDKPEILEHPTETWAAQDMRKSEVFRVAARHVDGPRRRQFLDKARYFFDASIRQLAEMETRALCRPLVLLQSLGYGQAYSERHPDERAPEPFETWEDLGAPLVFVPQKLRVKRKLVRLMSLAAVLSAAAAALFKWAL